MEDINIVLIDDHQLLSELLSKSLSELPFAGKIEVYNSAADFLERLPRLAPDIIILDLLMPGMNGLELIKVIRKDFKYVKILMLSSVAEVHTIHYALSNGANGYLHKGAPVSELARAIQHIHAGGQYLSEEVKDELLTSDFRDDRIDYRLSPQQKEVLRHICSGKTVKTIAEDMQLSVHTVQTYHKNILKKFRLNRTADLIIFAINNGLVPGSS